MQGSRPRGIQAPLQIGLGVQLHTKNASRNLLDSLHSMGFCWSYNEARKFERNGAISQGTDIPFSEKQFIQYSADNVDHNICTLDGNGSYHGMGIIASVTPATKLNRVIHRLNVTADDITKVSKIDKSFCSAVSAPNSIVYKTLIDCNLNDPNYNLNLLYKCSILFGKPRPSWSGQMEMIHQGSHPGKSSIHFLPMIDMNPSDATCIFSPLNS